MRRFVLIPSLFVCSILLIVPAFGEVHVSDSAHDDIPSAQNGSSLGIKEFATKYLGIRYKRGGTSVHGFDCSGFTRFIYKNFFGFELPHDSRSLYRSPLLAHVSPDDVQPGDIIFFASGPSKKRINHVGIYLDDNAFIHADIKRGITIAQVDDAHWRSRLVSIKRPVADSFLESGDLDTDSFPSFRSRSVVPSLFTFGYLTSCTLELKCSLRSTYPLPVMRMQQLNHDVSFFHMPAAASSAWHGFRLSADVMPFPGMTVAPSLFLNSPMDPYNHADVSTRSFGVLLSLWSPEDGAWFASASFRQSMYRRFAGDARASDDDSLDWHFMYSHRLSNSLLLSLLCERLRASGVSDHTRSGSDDQRLFMKLHFFY